MKKIYLLFVFFFICLNNVLANNQESFAKGPIFWNDYFYTKIDNKTNKHSSTYMKMFTRKSDQEAVYCIEPGVNIDVDKAYTVYDVDVERYAKLSKEDFEKVSLIAYFGYRYKDNEYDHSDSKWWAVTQWMIWQVANNNHTLYFTKNKDINREEKPIERFVNEIAEINLLVDGYYKKPSLNFPESINVGEEIIIEDKNNVIGDYKIICNNCNATIKDNIIKFKALDTNNVRIKVIKEFNNYKTKPLVYVLNGAQTLLSTGNINSIEYDQELRINGGKITINKIDKDTNLNIAQGDGSLMGAKYGIYNLDDSLVEEIITDNYGYATSGFLEFGKYYLQEIESSIGYELDNTKYYFDINMNNLDVKMDVYEKVITKRLDLIKVKASSKTMILDFEKDVRFDIYLKSTNKLLFSKTTDESGRISVVLPYGTYLIKQTSTLDGYEKIKDFEITVDDSQKDIITKVIANAKNNIEIPVPKTYKNKSYMFHGCLFIGIILNVLFKKKPHI